jgi:protein O-GlcNAc transferase
MIGCMSSEPDHEPAAESLRRALAAEPDNVALLQDLARCYVRQRKLVSALETYDRIIGLGAADAAVWLEAARTLCDVREYAQAIDALGHSRRLATSDEARYETARASFALGDLETARAEFESVAQATDSMQAWSSLAKIIPGVPSATHRRVREVRAAFADRLRREFVPPPKRTQCQPHRGHDRLRLGYLSEFFHRSNYMKPVWGLVNHHDRRDFEVHLFSDTPNVGHSLRECPDAPWEGYNPHQTDRIHETAAFDHLGLARLIRECEIDILIDLNAYSSAQRLPLFLEPVAPVVVAWFNLYATSGMPGIDAVIGDREVVRPEEEGEYTERVLCLPGSYLTFEVGHRAPPVGPPPCEKNKYFTFGSLVSQYKLTGIVLDDWAEILRAVEGSQLVLANRAMQSTCNQDYLAKQFIDRGVRREQLEFLRPAEHYQFLDYYSRIDVALDAYPYNGGTTTMEAIWQGVPVLTFDGDRWASRTSQTLLRRTHLAEFVAADRRAMVQTAVDMASDPQAPSRLANLRATMRERLLASPACDTAALACAMEQVYRQLAER